MSAYPGSWQEPRRALARLLTLALTLAVVGFSAPLRADDKAQVLPTREDGYARLAITFPDRLDLPAYRLRYENNVVALEFDEPVDALLPDVSVALPDYVSVARVDPDRRGIRFGLRNAVHVNRLEAGERLFIDLLPMSWTGLPPALPEAVVEELAERAKKAAIAAEQRRKAEAAKTLKPTANLRVGRNPTFVRIQFDWSIDTEGKFELDGANGDIIFDWPVPVDLYELKASLPEQIIAADNVVDAQGSHVKLKLAENVVPRFYKTTERQFVLDIDIDREAGVAAALAARQSAEAMAEATATPAGDAVANAAVSPGSDGQAISKIVPVVSMMGATVRVSFPFEEDTAAAVFRRGDSLWMLFDTPLAIEPPAQSNALDAIASGFEVVPAGDTKIVRIDLASERLATLGSEGRSWVLSFGDVLLNPTEPMQIHRHRDAEGRLEMTVDLQRPSQIHEFHDPVVGDTLQIVTAFPPARGVARNLQYVDFGVLRSVHGLVLKQRNEALNVAIEGPNSVLSTPDGLTMSALEMVRALDAGSAPEYRASYVNFGAIREDDPRVFEQRSEDLIDRASQSEGRSRDVARLELAQFYLANQYAHEAIGVLDVLESEIAADDLKKRVRLIRGVADTLARRPKEAVEILGSEAFSEEVDALMWRAIAKTEVGDYVGARLDAIAAESVIEAYPGWIRTKFLLAATRAAVETRDNALALRFLDMVEFAKLDPEDVTTYQLLQGRIAENEDRIDEALDTYGQVIAADIRPTRAEAVYRTLLLLDQTGRIDLAKATQTLSSEILLWRGNALEADMQKLLAELYFRNGDYRLGFETVKEAAAYYPESRGMTELLTVAQNVFTDLYLNGHADQLEPVDALSIYYDFQQLTPPGARGDEMIRNLARRLVKVDLLTQAADLLEYQIDSRLDGVAKAQVAADLAVIRIADRDPQAALRVLDRTRLAGLSPLLARQRRVLEARALIDVGRQELAIDLLGTVQGRDADMLRVEGYWKSHNFATAAELLETMHSLGAAGAGTLDQTARMDVLRAAVGFVLAGDRLALSRLRSKFSDAMTRTAEWAMFDFVTSNIEANSVEFRRVAREVSGLDSLDAFLSSYRKIYAGADQVTPERATPLEDAA